MSTWCDAGDPRTRVLWARDAMQVIPGLVCYEHVMRCRWSQNSSVMSTWCDAGDPRTLVLWARDATQVILGLVCYEHVMRCRWSQDSCVMSTWCDAGDPRTRVLWVRDAMQVVVVVVVGQTVGSISSKTLTSTVCTHLNCARHRWLLPVYSDIWGIFCPVFVQAVLERVYCSAAYNFTW